MAAPDAPVATAVTGSGSGEINVSWTPPASDGGSPITLYRIRYRDTADAVVTYPVDFPVPALSATLTGLVAGALYDVGVRAVNGDGNGPYSNYVSDVAAALSGTPAAAAAALTASGVLAAAGQPRIPVAAALHGVAILSAFAGPAPPPPVPVTGGGETVLLRANPVDEYDSDGNWVGADPDAAGVPLYPLEVAPGNTLLSYGIGGDLDDVAFTVYFELGTVIKDDDQLEVRGRHCTARVALWDSTGLGGLAVLARSTTGVSTHG